MILLTVSHPLVQVLQFEDVEVGEPAEGQVRIRQTAIGLNFIDIYYREGKYTAPTPFVPGSLTIGLKLLLRHK